MARDTRLNIEVTAQDRASQVIKGVQADADKLEQTTATVGVEADDNASPVLDDVDQDVRDLDGRKATVTVEADDQASRVLDDVDQDVRDLDGMTARVDVRVDDNATRVLEDIRARLRELDGMTATAGADATGGGIGLGGAGAAGAGAGLLGAAVAGGIQGTQMSLMVQQVANQTGASVEQASRLVTVWTQAGLDVADLLDILFNVNQVMADQPDLQRQLGIEITNNTTMIDLFYKALTGVNAEQDKLAQGRLMGQLFGEEGQRQVGHVQNIFGDIKRTAQELDETKIVGEDDIERARQLNSEWIEAKGHLAEIQLLLLRGLSGAVNSTADTVSLFSDPGRFFHEMMFGPLQGVTATGARRTTAADAASNGPGYFSSGLLSRATGTQPAIPSGPMQVIVNNPPGTAAYVDGNRVYQYRNGERQ